MRWVRKVRDVKNLRLQGRECWSLANPGLQWQAETPWTVAQASCWLASHVLVSPTIQVSILTGGCVGLLVKGFLGGTLAGDAIPWFMSVWATAYLGKGQHLWFIRLHQISGLRDLNSKSKLRYFIHRPSHPVFGILVGWIWFFVGLNLSVVSKRLMKVLFPSILTKPWPSTAEVRMTSLDPMLFGILTVSSEQKEFMNWSSRVSSNLMSYSNAKLQVHGPLTPQYRKFRHDELAGRACGFANFALLYSPGYRPELYLVVVCNGIYPFL